jgi:hypothetical protein
MIPSVVTTKTQEEENPFRGFQSRRYEAPDSFYRVENKAKQYQQGRKQSKAKHSQLALELSKSLPLPHADLMKLDRLIITVITMHGMILTRSWVR